MMDRVALLALAAFALVKFVRTFSWVKDRELAGVKPWACDVCSSSWAAIFLSVVSTADPAIGWLTFGDHVSLDVVRLLWWLGTGAAAAGGCLVIMSLVDGTEPPEPPESLTLLPGGAEDWEPYE